MAVAMHQISPVAHLPLVLGVVRTRNVAARIDPCCPPHPAHVLSSGRGVEALLLAMLDGHHALYKGGHAWRSGAGYPCSRLASRAPRAMITGWGRGAMPCVLPISPACLLRARSTPWRSMLLRHPGAIRRRRPVLGMGR
jgi:hypothetical protein